MNPPLDSGIPDGFILTLEVVPEDQDNTDPALVIAVGQDTADVLLNEGYRIKPLYTGKRGGFFVDVVIPLVAVAWAQKDIILTDVSELVTIFTPVVLVARHLQEMHEKRVGKNSAQQSPIKITVEIEGASIAIEAPDLKAAESALKLAKRFQTIHPDTASKVTSQSKTKLKGSIPKKLPRKVRKYAE